MRLPKSMGGSLIEKASPAGLRLVSTCLMLACFAFGCFGEVQDPTVQLNLSAPQVSGKTVSVNGGVAAPVDRIEWEWGDGQSDKHHFFPASHTYGEPGNYEITVRVYTQNNTTASNFLRVEVR